MIVSRQYDNGRPRCVETVTALSSDVAFLSCIILGLKNVRIFWLMNAKYREVCVLTRKKIRSMFKMLQKLWHLVTLYKANLLFCMLTFKWVLNLIATRYILNQDSQKYNNNKSYIVLIIHVDDESIKTVKYGKLFCQHSVPVLSQPV